MKNYTDMESDNDVVDSNKKEEMSKTETGKNQNIFLILIFLMPLVLLISMTVLNKGGFKQALLWFYHYSNEMFLSYILAFSLINLLLFVSRGRIYTVLANVVVLVVSLLSYASYVKTDLRGEPLTILDYQLIGEATAIFEEFSSSYFIPVLVFVIIWLISLVFSTLLIKEKLNNKLRFIFAAVSAVILLISYTLSIDGLSKLKVEIPADTSWNHEYNGFLLASLVDSKFLKIPTPDGYSKETMESVYERLQKSIEDDGEMKTEVEPNVVYILLESFWDLNEFTDLKLSEEPIPFFKELANETLSGYIEVPGIGGGTVNTEYEVLTGLSKKFIPNYSVPYTPYSSYIHRPIYSTGHFFSEMGYDTSGFHTYSGWFYRRNEVYKHLGFDKFTPLEALQTTPEKQGLFVHDGELNRLIIDEIENTPNRNFISAMTMQGHGPYDENFLPNKKIKVLNELSEETGKIIENYANLLKSVDSHIQDLVEYFENHEEPTMIVFYSDHIPPFGEELYNEIGFDMFGSNNRRVPAIIWSNYMELEGTFGMDASMISPYVLDLIGLNNQNLYMNYLRSYMDKKMHVDASVDDNMYRDFELLHYDIMHGNQYIYDFTGKPISNKDYTIGLPMEIDDVFVIETKDDYFFEIMGDGFSWMSEVLVNDQKTNVVNREKDKIFITVPKNEIKTNDTLSFVVNAMDTRGKVMKTTNEVNIVFDNEFLQKSKETFNNKWDAIPLHEQGAWELFDTKEKFDMIYIDLRLKQISYYVENKDGALINADADFMNKGELSDIYVNGRLYLSISKENSGWDGKITKDDIVKYLKENEYTLHIAK